MSNTSSSVTRAVSEAYLAITQSISQSLEAQQLIALKCGSAQQKTQCATCTNWWIDNIKSFNPPPTSDFINEICAPVCNCRAHDINMSQTIVVDFDAFLQDSAKDKFINQINNSLIQAATQKDSGIIASETKNTEQTVNDLREKMQSDAFQRSLQGLRAMQLVSLEGGGSVAVVDMNQAIKYISSLLENNSDTKSSITQLTNQIVEATTQITLGGLNEIIGWIVQIILFVVILIVLFFAIQLIFEAYTLGV